MNSPTTTSRLGVFLSPSRYSMGRLAALIVGCYLALAALLIGAAIVESRAGAGGDGSFLSGFAMMVTLPLSLVVMGVYSATEFARGVPLADQDGGLSTLVAYAPCAVVNALALWVMLRGRRIRDDADETTQGH